jgi:hypothetical protein
MATRIIQKSFRVEGVLTDVTTAKMSDPTGTYGIRRNDTLAVVVADGTNMTHSATGVYEYSFEDIQDIAYTAYVEFVYAGSTFHFEVDIPARAETGTMVASYSMLTDRVGHFLFGIRTGFDSDQLDDIEQCIRDGLHDVYSAHPWSFFRPIAEITTTAPYSTGTIGIAAGVVTLAAGTWPTWAAVGVLKVENSYYEVDSRGSNTQITLEDTSVTVAAGTSYELGRPEYDLPTGFEAISGDSDLNYEPGQNEWFRPVQQRHDSRLRLLQETDPFSDRPVLYSVRTVTFDATVGSRKRLALYPTPDAAYVLRVPMLLRPTMVDETNQYPVGGETLTQVIIEACLSAAERNFDEENKRHTERFEQMLPLAIKADLEKSSPTSLGPDRGDCGYGWGYGYDEAARASRIGSLTLDGDTL